MERSWWTRTRVQTALAAYFSYPHGDYRPNWYDWLLSEYPGIVSDVQIQFAKTLFRSNLDATNINLWHLAYDLKHGDVAATSCLPLLRAFPIQAKQTLLESLEYILWAAVSLRDKSQFYNLISQKLALKSMPPRQRAVWLAVGCTLEPEKYETELQRFLSIGNVQVRTIHFASFFREKFFDSGFLTTDDLRLHSLIVRHIGRHVIPYEYREGIITKSMQATDLVSRCIDVISQDSSEIATDLLLEFADDRELAPWHAKLHRVRYEQRVLRRENEFHHQTIERIVETFDGGLPSNPADLAAITLDCLEKIQLRLRTGSSNIWKQFWNENSSGKPTKPKNEDSCTSALMALLEKELPEGIDVDRDVPGLNEKRPDLRIRYKDFHVPVEAKKTKNEELWDALQDQLIGRYTADRLTDGYGIYIVYWFGPGRFARVVDNKRFTEPQKTADELLSQLTEEELRKVSVFVLDISQEFDV